MRKYKPFYTFQILLILCAMTAGCSESIDAIREQLEYTIERSDRGRIKKQIEARVGGIPLMIESMKIKETFKDVYSHIAIVKFKEKTFAKKQGQLPKIGSLPNTGKKPTIRVQFKYLKTEDRWYFDKYL